jgi:ArsR family transcriptional regulator, lead/cadmium/zinc/bismuth-responsive transcriptional repressor
MNTLPSLSVPKSIRRSRSALGTDESIRDLSELFHALGDPTRLKIVLALSVSELCVAELAGTIKMSESAVSHQLSLLKALRLIRPRKSGKQVYYALDDEHVEEVLRVGRLHVGEFRR